MNTVPIKLLIADDNHTMCSLLRDYFRTVEAVTVCGIATNGEDVLSMIRLHQPDVVLLDLIMPRLDGLSVLEQLSTDPSLPHPAVIVTTALCTETITRRTLELGANYYLLKPYHLEHLLDRILMIMRPNLTFSTPPDIETDLNIIVTRHLIDTGISTHIIGYRYCVQAIELLLTQSSYCPLMKFVYPTISEKNGTTVACVESAIRKAIATVSDPQLNRLSNRSFLSRMAEQIRLKYNLPSDH